MKALCSIIICVLLASCSTNVIRFKSVKCKFKDEVTRSVNDEHFASDVLNIVIKGEILGNWSKKLSVIRGHENVVSGHLYVYSDSSMIYIFDNRTESFFPNYNNVDSLKTEDSKLRLQNDYLVSKFNKQFVKDSLMSLIQARASYSMVFEGVDAKGFYWKDVKFGNISIGYIGVSGQFKTLFDRSLDSFSVR